ncbi:MAG: TerB family tellurite resistance protein, partial [Vicingaceae bacterium]|nr:TerB family tellurite resistance protein [Vicingaceae bacterium]
MSEEILIALMRLFAIISKQDEELSNDKIEFVRSFLKHQLSEEKVEEYFLLFEEHLNDNKSAKDDEDKKRTSVTDSVRILGICKRIGKSLTQQQKIIVIVRLFELINTDRKFSKEQIEIIDTASKVFKINEVEYKSIENFVVNNDCYQNDHENLLAICNEDVTQTHPNILKYKNLLGVVFVLRIE